MMRDEQRPPQRRVTDMAGDAVWGADVGFSGQYCESGKSFHEATFDLPPVAERLGFEVWRAHDLGEMLAARGLACDESVQVFELGHARYIERLLALDVRMSACLPWRIAVFTRAGATWFALADLVPAGVAPGPALAALLAEIEAKLRYVIAVSRI